MTTPTSLRCRFGTSSWIWLYKYRVYLASTATWEIFSATPSGNGLSPVLKAVPNLSSSQDETFSILTSSFAAASNLSAWGNLIRYLTLFPSLRVTERTICLPSSVANVCSPAIRLERLVLFTVSSYSQVKAAIKSPINNQPYTPTPFCLFIDWLLCR